MYPRVMSISTLSNLCNIDGNWEEVRVWGLTSREIALPLYASHKDFKRNTIRVSNFNNSFIDSK